MTYQDSPNLIQSAIQYLLSNGIVSSRIVIRRILLAADQKLRVKQLSVIASANLVNGTRVEIDKDRTGDVFARASLSEDSIKLAGVVQCLRVWVGASIFLEPVLEEVAALRE